MAHEGWQQLLSYMAGEDLTAHQYHIVKYTTGEIFAAGAGEGFGVLVDAPDEGDYGSVVVVGITKIVVGTGGVAGGDLVASDANGEAVVAAAGDQIIGRAMYTAAATELVTVVVTHATDTTV